MKTQLLLLLTATLALASFTCAAASEVPSGFSLKTSEVTGFHKPLIIEGRGAAGTDLLIELKKGSGNWKLALYLDGVEIPDLPVSYEVPDVKPVEDELKAASSELEAATKELPSNAQDDSPEAEKKRNRVKDAQKRKEAAQNAKDGLAVVKVTFILQRDSEQVKSRSAWDTFFRSRKSFDALVHVSLGLAGGHPVSVAPDLKFQVAEGWWIGVSCVAGLGLFAVLLFCVGFFSDMLRDNGHPGGTFSLGRTQMAFWGSLVFGVWTGVAILCGCMEHIPAQTLVLLGISASTGLGAIMVGASDPAVTQNLPSRGFLRDLITGDQGASFQRLQVVVWTVALGIFFLWNVWQTMSMPVFSDTLLVLMGISNGTYLGFKMQEGKITVDSWKAEAGQLTLKISGGKLPCTWDLTTSGVNPQIVNSSGNTPITKPGEVTVALANHLVVGTEVTLKVTDADHKTTVATGKVV